MDISITDFKQRCLEIIRRVEQTGKPVSITRRGKGVIPLDLQVVLALDGLPASFHGDPADSRDRRHRESACAAVGYA
ncbi:MAG TPA: type II toxin-antitoxin system prevent-host-death family antitoxin [Burkholderiales bacterium]|nr:type II toxin-antitoxin system prevent-host-death family antitoxin [Burkholderiales bacterium]